jgi:predicted metal-binding membrane protein
MGVDLAAVDRFRHGATVATNAALMLLLFAVAVMDLRWVAVLSLVVAAEKLLPQLRLLRCAIGFVAIAIGIGFTAVALGARSSW